VGIIAGSDYDVRRVTVAMVQSLNSIRTSMGEKSQTIWKWAQEVKVAIVDEVQHGGSKTYGQVLMFFKGLQVKIGLTGTLPDDKVAAMRVRGIFGDVLSTVNAMELAQRGFIVAPRIRFIKGNWDVNVREVFQGINWFAHGAQRVIWDRVRSRALINNELRNDIIASVVQGYLDEGVSGILVIVDMIEHGRNLAQKCGLRFIWSGEEDRDTVFDKFKKGEIRGLVCSPVLEEGIDVRGIKVVVLAAGGKSKIKLLQRIGRGMRKQKGKFDVLVVDFYDDEIPLLKRHSKARFKVYTEQGYTIDLEDYEIR